ncbi:unnamed protein product [Vitrella brassicaformis CCMP3155]|uniref:catechol O-methyltransferase n=1 Tax=Vitrella brassicaformis (strain CCMP3155) TaxID=1169540 RepID=A0A0G4F210_VITBC|nr:unnamed protein product [Vitrella brassicaformis CCMP3155]|eukprot:CEM05384.1 unnamed protein product [Vitrella brassicaformis CCMP3155]
MRGERRAVGRRSLLTESARGALGVASSLLLSPSAGAQWQFATPAQMGEAVIKNTQQGDIGGIIEAIDTFSRKSWMMNVGATKGELLERLLKERQPSCVLEVGTFCGYSALHMLRALPQSSRLTTIEIDPETAAVARSILAHAGVADRIDLRVGASGDVLPSLKGPFEFIFMDHWKGEYLKDLQTLERLRLTASGGTLVFDNVRYPPGGASELLSFLEDTSDYDVEFVDIPFEYRDDIPDAVAVAQYKPGKGAGGILM